MAEQHIALTFDYELFLGKQSGTVDNCLAAPTLEILKRIRRHSATALFFVDTSYLDKVQTHDKAAYAKVCKQIEEIVDSGCEVGFHLHPHWLDAVGNGTDTWTLENISRYRLHALDAAERHALFGESLAHLTRIVARADSGYRINTFRAGGWCLQPFPDLRQSFEDFGIEYDFSVTPGFYKNEPPAHLYDYRNAPRNLCAWRFGDDPCVPQENGKFVEIPVTAFKASLISLVANNLRIRGERIFGDGQGVGGSRMQALMRRAFSSERIRQLTLDMCSRELLEHSLRRTSGHAVRVFASHPKMFTRTSLDNLDLLLNRYQTLRSDEIMRHA